MSATFGGYSLPLAGHRFNEKGNYGYRSFDSVASLTTAIVKLYEEELLPYVGRGLCASVYTQLTDVEDETNGLVTYDREVLKVDKQAIFALSKKMTAGNEQ